MKKYFDITAWLLVPFLIGAAFHYFGSWAGIPALVVGGMYWIGLTALLAKLGEKK